MKILYISHVQEYGGAEVVLLNILRNNKLWDAAVFIPEGNFARALETLGIKIYKSKYLKQLQRHRNFFWPLVFLFNFILVAFELSSFVKKYNPDLIHANHLSATLYCILPALFNKKKLICHVHDIIAHNTLIGISALICSFFTYKIITVSRAVVNGLIRCKIKKIKIINCYNGIEKDICLFKDPIIYQQFFKEAKNHINIAQIGVIEPNKGLDVFIDGVDTLVKQKHSPNLKAYIIGNPVAHFEYIETLKNRIKTYGLENNIIFTGRISGMKTVYKNIQIVVLCSVKPESLSLVLIEAMSMGCTVIASRIGGIPEVIEDGINGLLFEPGNAEELAKKIKLVIDGKVDIMTMKKQAYTTVNNKFSLEQQIDCINNVYKEVI